MSHPILAFWANADGEALRATGIGRYGQWESYPIGKMRVVMLTAEHPRIRDHIANLHPDLVIFPGPNGNIQKHHADFVAPEIPSIKDGDACRIVMQHVYGVLGREAFNPDSY